MRKHDEKYLKRMNKRDLVLHVQELYGKIEEQYEMLKQPKKIVFQEDEVTSKFGCSFPVRFKTSEGYKTMYPGKKYDEIVN